jgi:hypothetical protein
MVPPTTSKNHNQRFLTGSAISFTQQMNQKDPSVEKECVLFVGGHKVGDSLPSI